MALDATVGTPGPKRRCVPQGEQARRAPTSAVHSGIRASIRSQRLPTRCVCACHGRRDNKSVEDKLKVLPAVVVSHRPLRTPKTMADAAWAELQAGESGARDKAWDRILKKNAVAKKAKKKRPPKRWEPPAPRRRRQGGAGQAAGAARDRRGVAATVGTGRAADGRRGRKVRRGPRHAIEKP